MEFNEDPKYTVTIHIYDLSQGMAKNMSGMFLGKVIDGIWHTGIVVYNKEYYFGGGICSGPPKQTPYGFPTKIEVIGETQIPQEIFHQFLQELSPKFTMSTYDLFKNNCNNFTEECCQFLTGKSIPSYITGLPSEVLNTPLGKMLEPMINNLQNQMINNSAGQQMLPQMFEGGYNPQALNFQNNVSVPQNPPPQQNTPKVIEITNYTEFSNIIKDNQAVVIDFFSLTCPPCMRIKPIYAQIAQETFATYPDIKFCSCNVSQVRDVSTSLGVQSIPTFFFYHKGSVIQRFSGANEAELRKQINVLKSLIGPSKSNNNISINKPEPIIKKSPFSLCSPKEYEFYLFRTEKKELPINKIKNMGTDKLKNVDNLETFLELASNIDVGFQYFIPDKKKNLLSFIGKNIEKYIIAPSDEDIPFYDFLRIMIGEKVYCQIFFEDFEEIFNLIIELLKTDVEKEFKFVKKPSRILIVRGLANAFCSESGMKSMLKKKEEIIALISKLQKFSLKSDKMLLEATLMVQFNYILSKGFSKETQLTILEDIQAVGKCEDISDNIILGVLLSINFLCFADKGFIESVKKNGGELMLSKGNLSKNERVVFAAKDADVILTGKV